MPTETRTEKGLDQQLIHLVSHPVRVKALVVLVDRTASPKEIAAELKESISTVSHHVKELLRMGMIELVDEKRRRGAVEHFYRAVMRPIWTPAEWEALSIAERNQVSLWTMQLTLTDAARAFNAGTFDARSDRHASRVPLVLDEEGWRKLVKIFGDTLDSIFEVQAESAERMAGADGAESFSVLTSLLAFEMPDSREDG